MSHSVLGFYHYIIHVSFNVSVQLGLKANLYCSCKSGSGALQPEGHPYKAVHATWGYERGLLLVFLGHEDLVVSRVCIQKREQVTPGGGIHNLVDARQGKRVLRACLVQIYEIYAKPPFSISLA